MNLIIPDSVTVPPDATINVSLAPPAGAHSEPFQTSTIVSVVLKIIVPTAGLNALR